MADSILPTQRIPQPGEGQSDPRQRDRRRRSRSPFRADYGEDTDGDRIELSADAGRQLGNFEDTFGTVPPSSALAPEHWRPAPPPSPEAADAAQRTALDTGRALRKTAGADPAAPARTPGQSQAQTQAQTQAQGARPARPPAADTPEDRVNVNAFGLPPRLFTGEVQTAVTSLVELLDTLREKLAAAEQREMDLLTRMEQDEIPGMLNRSTLMRRLDDFLALSRTEGGAVFGALIYLESYVTLRRLGGILRATRALESVARRLPRFEDNPMHFSGAMGGASLVVLGRAVEGEPLDEAFRSFSSDLRSRLDTAFAPEDGMVLSSVLRVADPSDYAEKFIQRLDDELRRTPFRSLFEPEDPYLRSRRSP
ncbi:hypothetical protein IHV25_05550 [Phaeovibrio sulfidiphilus]|uniref:GGDEF domain-containing protein n=1 Tax=Phaeovibrio sulfidiphilus TaxID=1220600 RepID=A0A8J7CQR4_9PROT|nr:hypothetical protein [Phaeovibrio sulfidiphilus]MBE1237110.1 hypothetical protein [Phaeovibrio sulfidiphilus]